MPKEKKKLFTATYYADGVRKYVRSAVSQREADRKAAKLAADYEAGRVTVNGDMRFEQYAALWLQSYKKGIVTDVEYKSHQARLKNHILPQIAALRMRDIRPVHLQKIMNLQAGKSKSHCNKIAVTIKEIFKRAQKDKMIISDPSSELGIPLAEDESHRSITPLERQHLILTAKTHRFGLALLIMLWWGLRPQEVAALQWCDIDQIKQRICVRNALKKDGSIGKPKSKAGIRDIPIPPQLWERFRIGALDSFIVKNSHGERMSHTAMRRAWSSFKHDMDISMGATWTAEKYGVRAITGSVIADDLTPYDLRHTYCTDLEAAGVPINVAKYLMGHSSIAITAKIYTHMREDTLENAAAKISEFGKTGATTGATASAENRANPGKSVPKPKQA